MYTVYSDTTLIHDGTSPDLDIHLGDPVLNIGDSVAGSFDMTVSPKNPGYSAINRFTSTIFVKRDGHTIWKGRVLTENKDFWNRRKLTAEGALAYLNDTNQEMRTYNNVNLRTFINLLISAHNDKVPQSKQFHVGTLTVSDLDDEHIYQTNYGNTWEEFKTNCYDRLGGHIRLRYVDGDDVPYFDYLEEYPNTATQEINFGENLLDFTRDWDVSDIATVIIPRGKQLDEEDENGQRQYVTVESVNDGSIYVVNQNAYNTFGRVERTVDFSEVDLPSTLLQLAQIYINVQQFDTLTMKVNAVDLHRLIRNNTNYVIDNDLTNFIDMLNRPIESYIIGIHDVEEESNPVAFELLDEVRCISAPHGLDRLFPITEISIPLDRPEGVTYTMGGTGSKTMTSSNQSRTSEVLDRIKQMPSYTNVLGLAKQQAAQMLNQRTTGYITITETSAGSEALIISNTRDWENATKRWMFNVNGLGFTRDQGQTYDIAITMDGSIVADFIKTGVLEDGYGLNYWNLTTGEFSLAWNTEFRNITGDVVTIVDINQLANSANDTAELAVEQAEEAQTEAATQAKKQSGTTNLINGTNILRAPSHYQEQQSSWDVGTWESNSNVTGKTTIEDVSNPPNQKIKKGIRFRITETKNNSDRHMIQREVPLGNEQVYCISCYARGTGQLQIKVGKEINEQAMYASATKPVFGEWKRFHFAFATGENNTYSSSKYTAGIISNKVDVIFGATGESGTDVHICGMKVERGNSPTDWGESDFDIQVLAGEYTDASASKVREAAVEYADTQADRLETFTRDYVEVISENDRAFTQAQRQALDESFTQAKVLKRLTNNYQSKGIYLKNNELYMNATYIRTGTLDAGIVKAGILTDAANLNKWNMVTGYLKTKNMEAENAKLNGEFECGSSLAYLLSVSDGGIYGYDEKKYVGSIDFTASFFDIAKQRSYSGLMMRAKGGMQIRMPKISVRNKNDNGVATACFTGKKEFKVIENIRDLGNGGLEWTWRTHGIHVINGLVTSVW